METEDKLQEGLEIIGTDQPHRWHVALQEVAAYDFYHLCGYHRMAEERGEGNAKLFIYRRGGKAILIPLLLRKVEQIPGLEEVGADLWDATSVYGYPGPIASEEWLPQEFTYAFQSALTSHLRDSRVVSVFSRTHPMIRNADAIGGLGDVLQQGQTVSIDLMVPEEERRATYRQGHRYEIRKLHSSGFKLVVDKNANELDEFAAIYHENMRRVGASNEYFFEPRYFRELFDLECFTLISCRADGVMVAGAIFSKSGPIAQYHLAATSHDWLKVSPMKLVIDAACGWLSAQGCTSLHLGGGRGSHEDALFRFKTGFSSRRHDFHTWRWVIDPEAYTLLGKARRQFVAATGQPEDQNTGFFPVYRA